MRMLCRVEIDTDTGNRALQDGSYGRMLGQVMERLQPEVAYAMTLNGKRGGLFIFDLKDPSQIPTIAEPMFTVLNASVEFTPVMTMDEVQAGLQEAAASASSQA
jgi:hypothetical protein